MKMTIEIEVGFGAMKTYSDVAAAVWATANSITDCGEPLAKGEMGFLFDAEGIKVGTWEVA